MWFVSWWLMVLRCAIKSKRPGMLLDGIILLHDNARLYTVNLVRDKLHRFGWETFQYPPYSEIIPVMTTTFLATWKKTFGDVGFMRTRKCKSEGGCRSISDIPLSIRLELIALSPSGINVAINTSGTYFWIKQIPLSLRGRFSVFIWLHLQYMYKPKLIDLLFG